MKDWDDLRFFLSVARSGSLSASSRTLRVDAATVSRRIASFEEAVGSRLFDRRPDGYRLTGTGLKLLDHAIRVEDDLLGLSAAVATEDRVVAGQVAVTASEAVTLSFLIPALPRLRKLHPGIRLDILSSNKVFSLARREADIALRSVRPDGGDLLARRIATLGFGLYASPGYLDRLGRPRCPEDLGRHSFVDWLEDYPRAETTVWYRRVASHPAVARMTGSQERLEAGLAGLGIVCLPHILVRGKGLEPILSSLTVPPMEIWLLAHPDTAKMRRVRAVMDIIAEAASALSAEFAASR